MKHMFKNILFHKKGKHDKNDAIKKAFSLFSVPSNENERIIKFWPLKFKEKDEETLYIIKLCDNMYSKKYVILVSHLISLLLMYSVCLIVGNINGTNNLFSVLKLTYILLHTFTAINIILILTLHATHYVEMFKSIKGEIFIFYIMMVKINNIYNMITK
ncbi:hypothetical protein [Plasmodium yoelii yoelii]|uniref:Uncharacterized protein n=1 Tax=Plasmodium yoelii yoelii TaxID=73239 RepID=Q7RNG2_PLAYO|nr:hypothetical protein [Plasmodium yoelii yoelii]